MNDKFIKIAHPILSELFDDMSKYKSVMREMKQKTKKRRQFHRKCWEKKGTHARLIYGGQLPNSDSDSSECEFVGTRTNEEQGIKSEPSRSSK